jgi:hypothetical protein
MDNETKKKINDISKVNLNLIPVKFDLTTLNMTMYFIYKDSVLRTRKVLNNIYKLFNHIDDTYYKDNPSLSARIWIIRKILQARLFDGYDSPFEFITTYLKDDVDCTQDISDIIDTIPNGKISHEESKYIIRKLNDVLEFGYVMTLKSIYQEILDSIDDSDLKTYKSIQDDLYNISTSIINIKRNTNTSSSTNMFSLDTEYFDSVIEESLDRLKDRNRILVTGIQRLNTLLSPGYLSKRLYTYLALPGKGKSTVLLKSALDIKKYNQGIQTKDPDKRPAVLFLTLENGIEETVERMYNMAVDNDDIRNYTTKQVIKKFKKEGHLEITDKNNIDIIIKEYKNREIDTNDLYSIINDLGDEGIEVIALIIDYMKRIRPFEPATEERIELKNITNELKEVAKFYDIPVITAQQLNRAGATVIDAAIQARKEDVTRLVGRDSIAGAWEIQENSDFTCIINPETKMDTGELYLTFKMLKRRYRSSETNIKLRRLEYFSHPFEEDSEIRLKDDFGLSRSLSLESLATKFSPTDTKGPTTVIERHHLGEESSKNTLNSIAQEIEDFEPFDLSRNRSY